MKGNAKRNGLARTAQTNPHSVPGGTGSGRITDPDDPRFKAHKKRPMKKGQARLERRKKHLSNQADLLKKRGEMGHSTEYHTPGSLTK